MYKLSPFVYKFSKDEKSKKIFLENSLSFSKNETIAIVGPSGGGKTTFLKILKGIIPEYSSGIFEGEITFHDKPLSGENFSHNLKRILYLFQNPFSQLIYPTTEEEFLFSMENFNFTREEMDKQVEKFEKIFGLKKLWGKKTSELSNGECQKLVLASLLAIGPEVLLLDEPTAFLDPEARKEFYHFLNVIKGDRLLIIVDHHVNEIRPLVTRVIEVSLDGKISEGSFEKIEKKSLAKLSLPPLAGISSVEMNIQNVSFSYLPKIVILKNVSAKFRGGEIIAIKGKNGEGKSTLLKLIAGIAKPGDGKIETIVAGKKYQNLKNFSNVGFIFQNPETHFFFDTIEEELKQSTKIESDLLERFFYGIDLQKSPFLLSEGEKRRLSILMTVFLGKSILLYDEPTFGQDEKSISDITILMQELKKTGILQIFVSHDEAFISNVADRLFVLESGSLNEIS